MLTHTQNINITTEKKQIRSNLCTAENHWLLEGSSQNIKPKKSIWMKADNTSFITELTIRVSIKTEIMPANANASVIFSQFSYCMCCKPHKHLLRKTCLSYVGLWWIDAFLTNTHSLATGNRSLIAPERCWWSQTTISDVLVKLSVHLLRLEYLL